MMMQIKNNASTLGVLKKQIVDLVSHFRAFLVSGPDRCLQNRQCESLQDLVNTANIEKVELNRRNDAVKEAAKKVVALSKKK